ncbi:MAG: YlxR family protein [Deltaproteobacteria bacterium]|nr:YlxR family protein [Deltaproteobacteria bacterium]
MSRRGISGTPAGPAGETKGPIRTCAGCRARKPKAELARLAVVRTGGPSGPAVVPDPKGGLPGRGAWVCRDNPQCLARAALKSRLARALRVSDPDLSGLGEPGPPGPPPAPGGGGKRRKTSAATAADAPARTEGDNFDAVSPTSGTGGTGRGGRAGREDPEDDGAGGR